MLEYAGLHARLAALEAKFPKLINVRKRGRDDADADADAEQPAAPAKDTEGSYEPRLPAKPEAKHSSAFSSSTKRGDAYLVKNVTPGAGEYEPAAIATGKQRIMGGDSMFKNKDERFKKSMELEYSAHVGPGSYAQGDRTVELDFKKGSGKVSSAFASTSLRADSFLPGN